jgi:hypothetical protein
MEISDDMYIIRQETAEEYLKSLQQNSTVSETSNEPKELTEQPHTLESVTTADSTQYNNSRTLIPDDDVYELTWSGKIPHPKWMTFYTKILTKLIHDNNEVTLNLQFQITSNDGISQQTIKEVNSELRELGLPEIERLKI